MDSRHERRPARQRRGQAYASAGILPGRVIKVGLVKNAVLVVGGEGGPVGAAVATPLPHEPPEVGFVAYLLGAHEPVALRGRPSGKHGSQRPAHLGHAADHRELPALLLFARKLVVDMVRTDHVIRLSHRHDIHALTCAEGQLPVVARHSCHDVVVAQRPARAHMAVLYPHVGVVARHLYVGDGVLYEYRRVRLAAVVHYLALVVDYVLYGQHRRNHLAARAEMVELAAWQWQHGHAERAQLGVVDDGVGAERAAELAVEVVANGVGTAL